MTFLPAVLWQPLELPWVLSRWFQYLPRSEWFSILFLGSHFRDLWSIFLSAFAICFEDLQFLQGSLRSISLLQQLQDDPLKALDFDSILYLLHWNLAGSLYRETSFLVLDFVCHNLSFGLDIDYTSWTVRYGKNALQIWNDLNSSVVCPL